MRLSNPLHLIVTLVALLTGGLTSTALAVSMTKTTVEWKGPDSFNSAEFTFLDKEIVANELLDITGSGLYEGCCKHGEKTTLRCSC